MFDWVKILLSSDKKFMKLLDNAVLSDNFIFLNKIVSSKRFKKYKYTDTLINLLRIYIRDNRLDAIKIIIGNNKPYFYNDFDTNPLNILSDCIICSNLDIFIYLYDKFYLDSYSQQTLFNYSIEYYGRSYSNEQIFEFLYNKIDNIHYDSFRALKYIIYYNREKLFYRFLNDEKFKDSFINYSNNSYDLFLYCVRNGYDNYLKKIIDVINIDLGQNRNELLLLSIDNNRESTALILLDNKVIDKYHRPSLHKAMIYSVIHNNKLIFDKILKLDFIDISYNNNEALITAINYNNYEFVKLILNNDKIDLSKHNEDFKIINNNIDNKIFMLLINIPSFRKYLNKTKHDIIKPIYSIKKIIRTLDE